MEKKEGVHSEFAGLLVGALFTAGTLSVAQSWSGVFRGYTRDWVESIVQPPGRGIESDNKRWEHRLRRRVKLYEAMCITVVIIFAIVCLKRCVGPLSKL